MRCVHESQMWEENCFITLTYDDDHLPINQSLDYRDFQLFLKRLRKHFAPREIRFFMCGEYGSNTRRPHFHAALFNLDFPDKKLFKTTEQKNKLYTSDLLDRIWGKGFTNIGALTYQSAAYIARYITDKITITDSSSTKINPSTNLPYSYHYHSINPLTGELTQLKPEFQQSSRNPGLGHGWYKKYKTDVFNPGHGDGAPISANNPVEDVGRNGQIRINGQWARAPRYYLNKYKQTNPLQYQRLSALRSEMALSTMEDNAPHRLKAKETVKLAQLSQLKRKQQS